LVFLIHTAFILVRNIRHCLGFCEHVNKLWGFVSAEKFLLIALTVGDCSSVATVSIWSCWRNLSSPPVCEYSSGSSIWFLTYERKMAQTINHHHDRTVHAKLCELEIIEVWLFPHFFSQPAREVSGYHNWDILPVSFTSCQLATYFKKRNPRFFFNTSYCWTGQEVLCCCVDHCVEKLQSTPRSYLAGSRPHL